MELLTAAAYARLRGCSREAVRKALVSGRIVGVMRDGRRLIDVDAANISWAARTDPTQQERGAPAQFAKTEGLAQASAAKADIDATPTAPARTGATRKTQRSTDGASTLLQEKTRSERLRIERQELDLAERRGALVSRDGMGRAIAATLIAAREFLEAVPDRLAAPIAAQTDADVVRKMIHDEIFRAMTLLSTLRVDVRDYGRLGLTARPFDHDYAGFP